MQREPDPTCRRLVPLTEVRVPMAIGSWGAEAPGVTSRKTIDRIPRSRRNGLGWADWGQHFMGVLSTLKRLIGNSDRSTQLMAELREGTANQSSLLNEVILGLANQTKLFNSRLKELAGQGSDPHPGSPQSGLVLELLRGIRDGVSNETKVMQEKLTQLVQGLEKQPRVLNEKLSELAQKIK
jgi:hypothetical protein